MTLLLKSREIKPYPALSYATAQYLVQELTKTEAPRIIVEYGSGGSTLFFLDFILNQKEPTRFVSIEINHCWYKSLIEQIRSRYQNKLGKEELIFRKWPKDKCESYLKADNMTTMAIPEKIRLLNEAKESLKRELLSKDENSSLTDGDYSVIIDKNLVNFKYFLRTEFFKDQYGESPVKNEYIFPGINEASMFLKRNLNGSIIFLIDGGPRMDILKMVFDLMKKFSKASFLIFIHDAYRLYYQEIFNKYPEGRFLAGTENQDLGNNTLFKLADKKDMSALNVSLYEFEYGTISPKMEFLLKKEAWVYGHNVNRTRDR